MINVNPCASLIKLARHVTLRDRVNQIRHSTRILRSPHPIKLGNLPDLKVRVGRVNSIELKLDPTITLNFATSSLLISNK